MASIFDVAKYILESKGPMSTWKLQKLCYYSQAWSIAWGDGSIFDEDFEAWSNGPVSPVLFAAHRGMFTIRAADLHEGNSANLTRTAREDVDIVLRDYGDKEAYWLREQSHSEDPWRNARGNLPDGAVSHRKITKEAMGEYYGSL